jgi:hypothetical protein
VKKIINYFIAVSLIVNAYSCTKSGNNNDTPDESIIVDPKKALTGTFIDFYGKEAWTQQDWDIHFQEMKDIGMNTVIVQYTAYNDITYFNSTNTFTSSKYPNALSLLLKAADNKDMSVYVGLYFNEEYWDNQTNADWLQLHADRCISIAKEINAQFGTDSAFVGWYIPHEPEPYAYDSEEMVTLFKNDLVDRISDKLHTLNSKPVSIAAFFNSGLTSTTQLRDFMAELCTCNLQVIMLQDGIGVNHVSLANVGKYFSAADTGLYKGTGYTGEFWTDLETFSETGTVTIDRIKSQLNAELATAHISKAVSYQYYSDMCPTGPGGDDAAWLRYYYVQFIKSLAQQSEK